MPRALPFPEPDRLVKVWEKHPGYSLMELSPANYRDINAATTSFTSLAAYTDMAMNLVGQGEPLRVEGSIVTGNLFSTLGRSPLMTPLVRIISFRTERTSGRCC